MAIDVKSGFWNNTYSFIDGRAPIERGIARKMNKRGFRDVRELMLTLMGVAPGSTAAESFKRKQAVADVTGNVQGGVQTIETKDLVNRVTTSGDVTTINARVLAFNSQPSPYATNADGNPRGNAGG